MRQSNRPAGRTPTRKTGFRSTTAVLASTALVIATVPAFAGSAAADPLVVDHNTLPRTVITTDGELDDMNSFTRFLYYTNEIDVDGIVYTSSVHHWKGDGEHTLAGALEAGILTSVRGQTAGTEVNSRDTTTWRWNPDPWIEEKIAQYGEIVGNLQQHDPSFPSADELLSKVAVGNVNFENDFSEDTPGSDLIKDVLLDDDERDVWLQAWGGQSTIARALLSIEEEYGDSGEWEQVREQVVDKAIIATIGHQDNAYADYIGEAWPDIRVYDWQFNFTTWGGYKDEARIPEEIKAYYKHPFFTEHINPGHGPLLEDFHLIGDGRWLNGESDAPGWQPGLAGVEYDLETWRMWDFLGPYEQFDMVSEGDTPAFLSLIDNGLAHLDDPAIGGWAGHFTASPDNPNYFTVKGDLNPVTGNREPAYSLYRWVPEAQDDFAARADWGMTDFAGANHAPTASVDEGRTHTVAPGREITLTGSATDPDGDDVTLRWWQHEEAGTYPGTVELDDAGDGALTLTVPRDAQPGQTIHVVLDATDDGEHTLAHHQRVVLTVGGPSDESGIPITAEIPELGGPGGALTLTVAAYGSGVTLTGPTNTGDRLRLDGALPRITVTDTRNASQAGSSGWSVAGRASAFTSGSDEFSAAHLGWTPWAQDLRDGVVLGDTVRGVMRGGPGLATPATLVSAPTGSRLGTATVDADLQLEVPVDTPDGNYESRLSISLFPVD